MWGGQGYELYGDSIRKTMVYIYIYIVNVDHLVILGVE